MELAGEECFNSVHSTRSLQRATQARAPSSKVESTFAAMQPLLAKPSKARETVSNSVHSSLALAQQRCALSRSDKAATRRRAPSKDPVRLQEHAAVHLHAPLPYSRSPLSGGLGGS